MLMGKRDSKGLVRGASPSALRSSLASKSNTREKLPLDASWTSRICNRKSHEHKFVWERKINWPELFGTELSFACVLISLKPCVQLYFVPRKSFAPNPTAPDSVSLLAEISRRAEHSASRCRKIEDMMRRSKAINWINWLWRLNHKLRNNRWASSDR